MFRWMRCAGWGVPDGGVGCDARFVVAKRLGKIIRGDRSVPSDASWSTSAVGLRETIASRSRKTRKVLISRSNVILKPMGRVRVVGWFLCFVALASLACNTAAPPRPVGDLGTVRAAGGGSRSAAVNERAIEGVRRLAMSKPDGTSFKLADFDGKIVIVDFWATYCPPCRKQAPELAELWQRYHDKGVEVVGMSLDDVKDQTEVLDFIKQAGMNYTVGYADDRLSAAFLSGTEDETGQPPIPQLFIFGKDGRLIEHVIGYDQNHDMLPLLERIVTEQLARN